MRSGRIGFLVLILVAAIVFYIRTQSTLEEIREHSQQMEGRIGDQVVIHTDTLIIVKWNALKETYTLSNGLEVDSKIIKHE